MAFHAFQERCVLRTDEYVGAREQIESRWTEIRTRIREVGPLPRYIFDWKLFDDRREEVKKALKGITKIDMERYVRFFSEAKSGLKTGRHTRSLGSCGVRLTATRAAVITPLRL
ncbi:putative retrotransposon hot spot protein 4 (RHS4) [Trypanosoma vivax]|nr:putative retrotransposon hot spot protein 4 (RHS4) [Trypanosoma vivax]